MISKAVREFNLKIYLPADLEDNLEKRLAPHFDENKAVDPVVLMSARTRARLTQAELAVKVGVSQKQVSMWESGNAAIPFEKQVLLSELLDLES